MNGFFLIELIELDHFLNDFCVDLIVLIELDHLLDVFCVDWVKRKQQATSLIVFVLVADFQPAL